MKDSVYKQAPSWACQNWIYISHLDDDIPKYWFLPTEPEQLADSMTTSFSSQNALGRSAPVFTFSYSGPRNVSINLSLHRDMMDELNREMSSNAKLSFDEDYVDNLVKALQAIATPKYNLTNRAVEPPTIAIRFGEQLFIKGVVTTGVSITYNKPILSNNLWAIVNISFSISEADPYDASSVYKNGSFRGVTNTLRSGMNIVSGDL